jgi:hypothetical protein
MNIRKRTFIGRLLPVVLIAALSATWATAFAQAPPIEEEAPPCDPATESCDDSLTDSEAAAADQAGMPDPDLEGGPQAAVEEDPAIEASADEVFTPGDEISEDYPIPLPSDI